jgi:hypothetical protein
MTTAHCPVCWKPAEPTPSGQIRGHYDTTNRSSCPGSYEPYTITLKRSRPAMTRGPIEHLSALQAHPGQRRPCARCGGRTYVYATATYTSGPERYFCKGCTPSIKAQYRWETSR